jgi:hypothetical protein
VRAKAAVKAHVAYSLATAIQFRFREVVFPQMHKIDFFPSGKIIERATLASERRSNKPEKAIK